MLNSVEEDRITNFVSVLVKVVGPVVGSHGLSLGTASFCPFHGGTGLSLHEAQSEVQRPDHQCLS